MRLPRAGRAAAELLPIEQQVAEAAKSPKATVVHFWAPWCPNCYGELKNNGWSNFIDANPNVNFIFVTRGRGDNGDGRDDAGEARHRPAEEFPAAAASECLAPRGGQDDVVPRACRCCGCRRRGFFATGKLRYALNYGEVRFPILQQLVKDAVTKWE